MTPFISSLLLIFLEMRNGGESTLQVYLDDKTTVKQHDSLSKCIPTYLSFPLSCLSTFNFGEEGKLSLVIQ